MLEIKELVDTYGMKEIAFWDDTFTLNKQRVLAMCKLLKEHKFGIVWSAHSRANLIDDELVKAMKDAGCWKLFFGFESMLQKNLDTLKKGIRVEDHFRAVALCKKYGIETECSFIFGIPGETYEDALETMRLINELNPDYMKCFSMTPMPGTELWEKADEYGELNRDLTKFSIGRAVFVPKSMKREELEKLVSMAYKKFYLRPSYMFGYLKKMRSPTDISRAWKGLRAVLAI